MVWAACNSGVPAAAHAWRAAPCASLRRLSNLSVIDVRSKASEMLSNGQVLPLALELAARPRPGASR